ncbi:ABC transporter permease [Arthrobacter alpinus]|uniref:ABC transporter permease n=1 Tax=Arthrobacter alpinus TaxID=656366 RepID=UPI0009E9B756|nr:ABC transporter permease [Arthrobacter alpinus]
MPDLAPLKLSGRAGLRSRVAEPWQFQAVPRWVFAVAAVGALFILLPLCGMVAKVNWGQFSALITSESSLDALLLSLKTATASTALCILVGVPLALVLARAQFAGQRILRALILLPLVVPPVVGGLALLYTFGREGLIGRQLNLLGIDIAFSTTAVVMAQAFVALPFMVLSLEGSLRTAGQKYEAVAATLGARPSTVLRRITLPLVLPGLVSGAVLAFARSLGEFGATLTFAGSLQGVTRTLPLEIYLQRETDPDAAVALSFLLIAIALVVVALAYRSPRSPLRTSLDKLEPRKLEPRRPDPRRPEPQQAGTS